MSKKVVSSVAGITGSSLVTITAAGLVVWSYLIDEGDHRYWPYFLIVLAIAYVIPAIICLVVSFVPTKEFNSGIAVAGVFLILGGLIFTTAYIFTFGAIFRDIPLNIEIKPEKVAFGVSNVIGSVLLLVSGVLRMVIFYTERPKRPRNGGYPQYNR